jgi:hypothetical protein
VGIAAYARWTGIAEAHVPGMREALTPPASLTPERVAGIDGLIAEAPASRALAAPPGAEALRTLIQGAKGGEVRTGEAGTGDATAGVGEAGGAL